MDAEQTNMEVRFRPPRRIRGRSLGEAVGAGIGAGGFGAGPAGKGVASISCLDRAQDLGRGGGFGTMPGRIILSRLGLASGAAGRGGGIPFARYCSDRLSDRFWPAEPKVAGRCQTERVCHEHTDDFAAKGAGPLATLCADGPLEAGSAHQGASQSASGVKGGAGAGGLKVVQAQTTHVGTVD